MTVWKCPDSWQVWSVEEVWPNLINDQLAQHGKFWGKNMASLLTAAVFSWKRVSLCLSLSLMSPTAILKGWSSDLWSPRPFQGMFRDKTPFVTTPRCYLPVPLHCHLPWWYKSNYGYNCRSLIINQGSGLELYNIHHHNHTAQSKTRKVSFT